MKDRSFVLRKPLAMALIASAAVIPLLIHGSTIAATPDALFQNVTQPSGLVATQSEVLVSQPFCVNDSQTGPLSPSNWQILAFDTSGNQTLFATLPSSNLYGVSGTLGNCAEVELAIATGAACAQQNDDEDEDEDHGDGDQSSCGGFPTGHVYAAQGGHVFEFDQSGNFVQTLADIPSLDATTPHTGLAFDNAGTFNHNLIVVGTNGSSQGEVWTVDSQGNTNALLTNIAGGPGCNVASGVPCLESAEVAPLDGPIGTAFPGFLFTALPGFSGVSADIGALSPSLSLTAPNGANEPAVPEATRFVPSSGCTFDAANGQSYEFFNTSFGASGGAPGNTIFAYKASDFAGLEGQLLVTTEEGLPGIVVSTDSALDFSTFDNTIYFSEGSSFVQCPQQNQEENEQEEHGKGHGHGHHGRHGDKDPGKGNHGRNARKHHVKVSSKAPR